MKLIRYYPIYYIVILIISWQLFTPLPCYANPVVPRDRFQIWNPDTILYLWTLCPLIEALVIVFWLRNRFTSPGAAILPFILIVLLNLLTVPATQILAAILYGQGNLYKMYLAELLPLAVESAALFWFFKHLRWNGNISKPVSLKLTLLLVLIVNAITLLIGLIF